MILNSIVRHWSYRIIAPGTLLREQYEALRRLLQHDISCHEQMADIQDLLYGNKVKDFAGIRQDFTLFSENVAEMVEALDAMAPGKFSPLKSYHRKFDFYCRFLLAPAKADFQPPYTLRLDSVAADSKNIGNKARQLALASSDLGLEVPDAFAVTADGYHYLIDYNGLRKQIDSELASLDIFDMSSLEKASNVLSGLVRDARMPPDLKKEIFSAFDSTFKKKGSSRVAVRSNAVCEDGESSFAGQFSTVLNVGRSGLMKAYREVLASKYSTEALYYRIRQGWGDEEAAMSVLVMEMVPADAGGVMYTRDPRSGDAESAVLSIHAVEGLGEKLVSGTAVPEVYEVSRNALSAEAPPPGEQTILSARQVAELAEYGLRLEQYFGAPLDIEWALSQGKPAILQARPLYVDREREEVASSEFEGHELLAEGCESAARGTGAGRVFIVNDKKDLVHLTDGAVLVCREMPPDYVKSLRWVSAVICERGSRASHFATVAREFGVPLLCSVSDACRTFMPGMQVTVDGNSGKIFRGIIEEIVRRKQPGSAGDKYRRILSEVLKFITPLELTDPAGKNFTPEGCRSMHDIIRFCHEKALVSLFTTGRPGSGRGSSRLDADIPLDVYLFDVGGGITGKRKVKELVALADIASSPFHFLWRGLSHPDVVWKQKPFDWDAYDKIELAGGVPPKKDSFSFASYAVIGPEYLHFNLRFGYHFTIVDVMCGDNSAENHCMLRFAGGGGDYDHRSLRIEFIARILSRLEFIVEQKGDLLEARKQSVEKSVMEDDLDMLGRLLGATKLMDMVLEDDSMVEMFVDEFFQGRYSFSQEG